MTGTWLIVKWAGITVLAFYLVLIVVVLWRFRGTWSRLRSALFVPIIVGSFVALSVPSIFENMAVTRTCFVAADGIYIGGIVILLMGLAHPERLLKADG